MNDPASSQTVAVAAQPSVSAPSARQKTIGNELDAAKAIVAALDGLEKQQQERALRYASETLGLHIQGAYSATPPAPTPAIAPVSATPGAPAAPRAPDIKQFTESKAPKTDNQFAAVVAYYYRFEAPPEQQRDTINDATVRDAARMVGRKRPSRQLLHNAKNRGYLDALGGGEFRINNVGENLGAVTLPNDEPARRKAGAAKPRKPAKPRKA